MGIWNTIFYQPLYNALIFLVDILPGGSLALAIIVLTIIVKLILAPLSLRALRNQLTQKRLQPYVSKIRARYSDKQEQAAKLMEFYKLNKTNPFSGCLLVLLQLPIILALYTTFLRGVEADPDLLYSFVTMPANLGVEYLGGFINLQETSIALAIATGLVQLVQVRFSPTFQGQDSNTKALRDAKDQDEMQAILMQKVQRGMRYFVPVMITIFATLVPAAVALYWMTSNLFTIVQEIIVTHRAKPGAVVMPEGYE